MKFILIQRIYLGMAAVDCMLCLLRLACKSVSRLSLILVEHFILEGLLSWYFGLCLDIVDFSVSPC